MKIHNFSLDEARKFADEIRAVFRLSPFRLYLALDAIYKKYKFLHSYIKFFNFLEFYFWHRLIIIFHIFYSNFFSKRLIQKVSFPNYIFWKAIYSQAFDLQSKIILFLNGRLPILHCLAQPYFFVKFRCFPDVLSFFIKRYINRTPDISRILFL